MTVILLGGTSASTNLLNGVSVARRGVPQGDTLWIFYGCDGLPTAHKENADALDENTGTGCGNRDY
jgi:hypothetical protein